MTQPRSFLRSSLLIGTLVLTLAACQSAEDRAEERYQSALELIGQGDQERALVELRNVFDLNCQHREARSLYAATVLELGRIREAYSQYLLLVEQYPDDVPGLIVLSQLALERGDWDSVLRYGNRVRDLAPEDPDVEALAISIDYVEAREEEDDAARRAVAARARTLLETRPDTLPLHRIVIDEALRDENAPDAIEALRAALVIEPGNRALHDTLLRVLVSLGDRDALEQGLYDRLAQFPDDETAMADLVRYLVSAGREEAANAVLTDYVAVAEDAETRAARQAMRIGFVLQQEGPEAALDALDIALVETREPPASLRALRARIRFGLGQTDAAISELQDLLLGAGTSVQENEIRILLARTLEQTGNRVGAQRRVAEVLESDASQGEALKLQAAWDIEADAVDAAIAGLRTALDADPEDTGAMALMAQAHLRNGNRALAGDMLSLAVDVSNRAPAETRRYVDFLLRQERYLPAEEALIAALRQDRGNLPMMLDLARVYRGMEDWLRAADVETSLRNLGTPEAAQAADELRAVRLAAEGRTDEALSFLEDLAASEAGDDIRLRVAVLRGRLQSGDTEGARAYADDLLAEDPDGIVRRLAHAATLQALGDLAEAEAGFRALAEDAPGIENVWMSLMRLAYAQGDAEAAEAVLAEGLAALPAAPNLLWAQASLLERQGDAEGALAIYERLYAAVPNNAVVANNLASLLSTLREDPESLERAWAVARRLRDAEVPAFQDTYGWIAHRRGDTGTAIEYLEPAAEGLPGDPAVQYHLGMAYLAAARPDDAAAQFRRALEIELPGPPPAQVARARAELDALEQGETTGSD